MAGFWLCLDNSFKNDLMGCSVVLLFEILS